MAVGGVHYYKCDVTDFAAIQKVAAEIKSAHGAPSVLINNAGVGKPTQTLHSSRRGLTAVNKPTAS